MMTFVHYIETSKYLSVKDSDLRGSTMDKKKFFFFKFGLIWLSVCGVLLVKMANDIPHLLGICLE